ncbi:restriction endonuclease subunit S [Streptomyces sp. NBC_01278]|uniref:restriction endonuclease subunit S n=1 Tax=Streptomyces sp. NBC_01278 TaxID=2903809 RepID=UPI002E33231E|nr:restriction endonuclease subunit S [Streptomyces sp. NBC_01278]
MSEWRATTLDQLVKLQRGHDLPTEQRRSGNVPVVGAAGPSGLHDTAIAKAPGVVIGRAGASMGHATYCDVDFWPLNTSLYVTDFLGNEPRFAYYLLGGIDFSGYNSGAAQPMLNRNYIKQISINLPPRREQKAISSVLGALDDKASINEAISMHALHLGTEEFRLLSASTQEDSTVGDLVELRYGKALPSVQRTPGDIPVFGSGGVGGRHSESLVKGPGVIVGRKGTVGAVYWSDTDFFPIDTTFYVSPKGDRTSLEYMYFALRSLGLEHMNSDSAVPGLNRERAHSLRLRIPTENAMQGFTAKARDLFELRRSRAAENVTLASLRGALLPQLMSGRLRVKDAEKIVEDHV